MQFGKLSWEELELSGAEIISIVIFLILAAVGVNIGKSVPGFSLASAAVTILIVMAGEATLLYAITCWLQFDGDDLYIDFGTAGSYVIELGGVALVAIFLKAHTGSTAIAILYSVISLVWSYWPNSKDMNELHEVFLNFTPGELPLFILITAVVGSHLYIRWAGPVAAAIEIILVTTIGSLALAFVGYWLGKVWRRGGLEISSLSNSLSQVGMPITCVFVLWGDTWVFHTLALLVGAAQIWWWLVPQQREDEEESEVGEPLQDS